MDITKADEILGIAEPAKPKSKEVTVIESTPLPAVVTPHTLEQVDETLNTAKANIADAIETMTEVVKDAALIARQNGLPDSYSAVSSLFTTFVQANKAIVDIETKQHAMHKKAEQEANGPPEGPTTVHNEINFHGTTDEFLKMLENAKKSRNVSTE